MEEVQKLKLQGTLLLWDTKSKKHKARNINPKNYFIISFSRNKTTSREQRIYTNF